MAATHVLVLGALLASLLLQGISGRVFNMKDDTGQVCAELNADFTMHFLLIRSGKVLHKQDIDQNFSYISRAGDCASFFRLMFGDTLAVRLEFRLVPGNFTTKELTLHPSLQFQPFYVFGDRDAEFMDLLYEDFTDNPVMPDLTYSYQCDEEVTHNFAFTSGNLTKATYDVSVRWSRLQVQIGHMPGGQFGPAVTC